jgi:molybdate transport system regulatory protein
LTADASRIAVKLKAQLYRGEEIAMGPGKAALLDAIADTGSISAAGRKLGMSYRRAWLLVDTMNRCWREPLVETSSQGAALTAFGHAVRADYARLTEDMAALLDSPACKALRAKIA